MKYIVRVLGGLGNQLFQYALIQYLDEPGFEVKADLTEFPTYTLHHGYELERVFGIQLEAASENEIASVKRDKNPGNLSRRLLTKFGIRQPTHWREGSFQETWLKNPPSWWRSRTIYLDGYWQSTRFLPEDTARLRSQLRFPEFTDGKNQALANEMRHTESVSVHVRGGDYVSSERLFLKYGSVCGQEYYRRALEKVRSMTNPFRVYVFTDDPEWVRSSIDLRGEAHFVQHNSGPRSFRDMQLMGLCKYNIIANSSFSWWGAWLNQNPDRRVLAPAVWKADGTPSSGVIPDDWIQIQPG